MIDDPFRKLLPRYAGPLVATYKALGLTPNMISLASVAVASGAAYLVAEGRVVAALLAWWGGRLFDGTDGIHARATGQASSFGAYLDIVCDMASYSVMILGFMRLHPDFQLVWSGILVLYVLCITTALALGSMEQKLGLAARDNRGLRLGAGLAEGGETGIAYTLFLLLPGQVGYLAEIWLGILVLTVISRTVLARRVLALS